MGFVVVALAHDVFAIVAVCFLTDYTPRLDL